MQRPLLYIPALLRNLGVVSALLALAACVSDPQPHAAYVRGNDMSYEDDMDDDDSFDVASVSDPELSGMRGGFLLAGGLKLDFGLTSDTMINGAIVSTLNLNTSRLPGGLPINIQHVVQVGTGNNFDSPASANTTATVLTLVQNTQNNSTITNKNVLNLTVSNFQSFNMHNAALNSILPMVRALR